MAGLAPKRQSRQEIEKSRAALVEKIDRKMELCEEHNYRQVLVTLAVNKVLISEAKAGELPSN